MTKAFVATLLLADDFTLEIDSLAKAVAEDYPSLREVTGIPSQTESASGVLMIETAQVVVQVRDKRLPNAAFKAPDAIHRPGTTPPDIAGNKVQVDVSSAGQKETLDGAEGYAGGAHIVAASILKRAKALGAFWHASGTLTGPADFTAATGPLFEGKMPLDIWVGFAPMVPEGYAPEAAMGMVTHGLRPFLGRELELAPRPGDIESAHECLCSVTRRILDDGMTLRTGQHLSNVESVLEAKVRRRDYWLRRDRSTFVLVTDDAIIENDTLNPPGQRSAA